MARCAKCAALAREAEDFDVRIQDAAMVPVPEALADRVLLRHRLVRGPLVREPARFGGFGFGAWALAASLVIALGVVIQLYRADSGNVATLATVGEGHAAIAAINYVLENEPRLLKENVRGDPAVMKSALAQLGLKLPARGTTVRYLGKCPVPGGDGDHLVLRTPFGHVTLILVPERSLGPRVVVAYRDQTAVVNPVRSGSYIMVTDSLQAVNHLEQQLM